MTNPNNRQRLGSVVEEYKYILREQDGYLSPRVPCLLDGDSVLQVSDTSFTALHEGNNY